MTSKKTRRALFSSAISLLLCCSMLVGTTFAWFTDKATSSVNTIQAGKLDVVLEYWDGDSWEDAEGKALDFIKVAGAPANEKILWEPGCTYKLPAIRVGNNGDLKLKYEIVITGIDGDAELNEAIEWTYNEKAADAFTGFKGTLEPKGDAITYGEQIVIQGHMKENAGNEYQGLTIDGIAITVFATQVEGEFDSFKDDYDDITVAANYDELYNDETYGNSGNFIMTDDIALGGTTYFGDNTNNTIDLNGNTLAIKNGACFMTKGAGSVLSVGGEGTVTAENYFAAFVTQSSTLNLNGGTYELGVTGETAHFFVQNSATLVINGGEFISTDANTPIAYCINGFIEINGGLFRNTANPGQALLSMGNNLSYVNNQKITLSGGTFVNWNPMSSPFAQSWPQAPAMIVLADGYKMISETQANGDIWYTVVPE